MAKRGGIQRSLTNAKQLHEHKGKYYEKWKKAMKNKALPRLQGFLEN